MFICNNVKGLLLQDCMLISTVIASCICSCVLFVRSDSNSSKFELLALDTSPVCA